jgi:hypothetical protein
MIVGIDPGKDGAVVGVGDDGSIEIAQLTTDLTIKIGKGTKREYLPREMHKVMQYAKFIGATKAVIEKQQAMPKQGVSSTFSIGLGYGLWVGLLTALEIPIVEVRPAAWQKVVLKGAPGQGKGRAVYVVQQRLPALNLTPGKKRKPHDGLADAGCLTLYGQLQ